MKVARAANVLWLVVLVSACKIERRTDPANAGAVRSDVAHVALPTDPHKLAALLGVPADSLRAAGEERYSRQEYDSARAIWEIEVTRAQHRSDASAEARARMWLGLAEWRLGDFAKARTNGETSVAMKRKLGLDAELSRSFNALGLLAWQEGRYADALVQFDSAVASAKRNNDAPGLARASGNIPLVQVELGDFDAARKGFTNAIDAGARTRDDRLHGNALANLAMLEIRLGNGAKALPLLAEARRHYAKIEYTTGEANALGQLSTAWSQLGELQRAIDAADSGLAIARAEGSQQEVAATLEVRADLEAQAGNLRRSLQTLHTADSLDQALGLALERGTNQRRMAALLTELGEPALAVARARDAVAAHVKVAARNEECYDRMQLAYALALSGDSVGARRQADAALYLAIQIRNPGAARDAAGISAQLALLNGNAKGALGYLDRIPSETTRDDWRLTDLRAVALLKLGRLAEANAEGKKSLRALERERASLGDGPLRAGYLANRTAPFSHLIEINIARRDTAAAFAVAASLPGRSLSERLGGVTHAPQALAGAVGREDLLLRVAALERALDEARSNDDPPAKQNALERSLQSARTAFEDLVDHEAAVPSATATSLVPPTLPITQRSISANETLLIFVSGPENLDVFAVTRSRLFHASARVSGSMLMRRVKFARDFMNLGADSSSVPKPLGELFDLLVKPASDAGLLPPGNQIIVATEGALSALPFAALWNKATGRFLVEDHTIRYLPSLAALVRPVEGAGAVRSLAVFAPIPDSLPGTRTEARSIAATYPTTVVLMGPGATEDKVRSALRGNSAIHVASHGSQNAQNPLFSRMIVGRPISTSAANDGRLEVHEILGLTTRSPLVFLSGCETAAGSGATSAFNIGGGDVSLAHAFLIAGAETVVATLWRIDDSSAASIAASFYRQLRAGAFPDEALAAAQRQALAKRRSYTWAAYDVFGGPSHKLPPLVRTTSQ